MDITVTLTDDPVVIRRWLMRPSMLPRITRGYPDLSSETVEKSFKTVCQKSKVYLATKDGKEQGCVVLTPTQGGWELHLCLATWFSKTRGVVLRAIYLTASGGETIYANYCEGNEAVTRLLDDLEFDKGVTVKPEWSDCTWRHRSLFIDS